MIYTILTGRPEFMAKKGDKCFVLDTSTTYVCIGRKSWVDEATYNAARAVEEPKKAKRASRSKKTPSTPK